MSWRIKQVKKELSNDEQENIIQENIKKFDEQYKQNRIIPKDYKKKIVNRILKNTVIAVIAIAYLILLKKIDFVNR